MDGVTDNVRTLFGGGDPRCQSLAEALLILLDERAAGMPFPLVLGVLRIVEHDLVERQRQ